MLKPVLAAIPSLVLCLFVLSGCESAQRILLATGPPIALLRTPSGTELVLGACDTSLSSTCGRAEKTDNPKDEVAWHFNVQIRMTGPYGAKVGTAPMTVYVLGGKEKCDAMYATWPHENSPCEGPVYFKRG
jgi:hypothetical protein